MTAATELASGATPAGGRDDRRRRINGARIVPLLVAVVVLGVVGAVSTAGFASVDNIRAIVTSASITGIAAVGMTFVTLSGNYFSLALQQTAVMAGLCSCRPSGTPAARGGQLCWPSRRFWPSVCSRGSSSRSV